MNFCGALGGEVAQQVQVPHEFVVKRAGYAGVGGVCCRRKWLRLAAHVALERAAEVVVVAEGMLGVCGLGAGGLWL